MSFIYPVDKKDSKVHGNFLDYRPNRNRYHYGKDFGNHSKCNNIYGVVIWSNYNSTTGYGNTIIIQHSSGIASFYAHMIEESLYQYGDYVKQGTVIGKIGETGGVSSGPHLHFEVIDIDGANKIKQVGKIKAPNIGISGGEHRLDPDIFLPINKDNPKSFARERTSKYFKWKCEGKNSCNKCKERDGKIYQYGIDKEPPLHYNCDCIIEDYVPQTKRELFDLELKEYKRCFNRDMNIFKECIDGLRGELRELERKYKRY